MEFRSYDSYNVLSDALALYLAELITSSVKVRGLCRIVFPGGRSIRGALERLWNLDIAWSSVHLFLADERCLPRGDFNRNDAFIMRLNSKIAHECTIHLIQAELGANTGADLYSEELSTVPEFDVVVLGLGSDNHIASLFAENTALRDDRDAVPVFGAPKATSDRVSMGIKRLHKSRTRVLVAIGKTKSDLEQTNFLSLESPAGLLLPTICFATSEQH